MSETERMYRVSGNKDQYISIKILRAIAQTSTPISLESIHIASEDIGLVWLALEKSEGGDIDEVFIYACEHGRTDIVHLLLESKRGVHSCAFNSILKYCSRSASFSSS